MGVANPQVSDIILELVETITDLEAPADSAWLTRVEEQLAADFRKSLGLAGLAKSVGVHPVHLARMFRRRHGHSVTEHIQRLRVHDAVKQILAGDSIGSAALDAGFADQFHFTRTLKARFGYCPMLVKRLRCFNRS
jgi:AraC family transcriptional regulator